MLSILGLLFSFLGGSLRSRVALQAEILALRHQLLVLERSQHGRRPRLQNADRIFWVWLSRLWQGWRSAVRIVKADNSHCLEPQRVPSVLALEEPETPRPTLYCSRRLRSYQSDEPSESGVGCSAHSWRTHETRHQHR